MNWLKCVDIIALLIQLIAATIMYLNSPVNRHIVLYTREENEKFIKNNNLKNKRLKQGFLLLVIGLAISLITTILN